MNSIEQEVKEEQTSPEQVVLRAEKRATRLLIVGNGPTGIAEDGAVHVDLSVGQLLADLAGAGMRVAFAQPIEQLNLNLNYYGCILPPDKITLVSLDSGGFLSSILTGWRLLWRLLRTDFVYLFFPGKLSRLVGPICRLLRKRYAVYLRGDQFGRDARDDGILERAEFVTVTSPALRARALPCNRDVELIRPIFDLSIDDSVRRDHRRPAKEPLRLLFVGRIEAEKGVPELLDAAALLQRRGLSFDLALGRGRMVSEQLFGLALFEQWRQRYRVGIPDLG